MKEEEWKAWETIKESVLSLEEEGEWRDENIRITEMTMRKPTLIRDSHEDELKNPLGVRAEEVTESMG